VRSDLVEWLAYLGEIGVRELSVPPERRAEREPKEPEREEPARKEPGREEPVRALAQPSLSIDVLHDPPPADPAAALAAIRDDLGECTRCKLHRGRTQLVFGVGNPKAQLMFVGEGPGAEEDLSGLPFVGRAGRKLDEMIRAIGFERPDVYIANVVKCRPPDNRDPEPDEIETCSPFLARQIEAVRPKVIVTLGAPATRTLLGTRVGITKLRGTWQVYRGIPVMPTYHPAFLLRQYTPENRRKVFDDLKAARARLDA
jgi:DNA polymerase